MLRPIKCSHTAISLVPNAKILQFGEDPFAGVQKLAHMAPIHANERDRTVPAGRCREPKSIEQETRELLPIHLPHAHRKVAVADAPQAADIAFDLNIVRRIAENQIDAFIPKDRRIGAGVARISTKEFVPPEYPKIARARNRWPVVPIGRDYFFDRGIRTLGALSRASSATISTSAREKPVNSTSNSRSTRPCNSIASISRSQPAH